MVLNFPPIPVCFVVIVFISRLKSSIAKSKTWINSLRDDTEALKLVSADFGNIIREIPAGVLYPSSINDIISLIKFANNKHSISVPFNIAAKGCGHSVRGQAMVRNGIVIEMTSMKNNCSSTSDGHGHGSASGSGSLSTSRITVSSNPKTGLFYADVGGEQLWIDVLNATLEFGLAPESWTDYLYITVGGTLSNAGISGQTFRYGPQISNVTELDVITGKGDFVTCSREKNSELFHAVLGGLGQFGIIVRARIPLYPAPKRVKWVRMLYNNFSEFAKDQERLISINGKGNEENGRKEEVINVGLDYLEGLLLMHDGSPDNWRSSFFPLSDHSRIISLVNQHSIIYCLEVAKYYYEEEEEEEEEYYSSTHNGAHFSEEGLEDYLLKRLNFLPGFIFEKDILYTDFLNRVRSGELMLQSQGLWDVPHPWLNLFVPKSQISDFNSGVFKDIVLKRNITKGPVLIYPMNKNKWDDRMSAVIPDEDVFYAVGFLHSSGFDDWEAIDEQNKEILKFCNNADMKIKQYLPHYKTQADWEQHFGSKWIKIQQRKKQFDPKMILSPGQKIFNL